MKKTLVLLLLIFFNFSCSTKLKSIDRKISKIEKTKYKNPYEAQNICWNCNGIDSFTYYSKSKSKINKINFEIDSNINCKDYSKKVTIYIDNNIPILISEITNGTCKYEITGVNKKTKKLQSHEFESKISSNVKIYINDWAKFQVTVIGGNKFDYNLKVKEKYQEIINKVLEQENLK